MLESSIGLVARSFSPGAGGAGLAITFDESPKSWPDILVSNKFNGLVLSEVSRKRMIVFVPENVEAEIVGVRYVDAVVEK